MVNVAREGCKACRLEICAVWLAADKVLKRFMLLTVGSRSLTFSIADYVIIY